MLNLLNTIFKKLVDRETSETITTGESEDTAVAEVGASPKYTRHQQQVIVSTSGSPSSISSISSNASSSSATSSSAHLQKAAVMAEITNRASRHRKLSSCNNSSFDTENETSAETITTNVQIAPAGRGVNSYSSHVGGSYGHSEKKKYYLKGAMGGSEDELEGHDSNKMVVVNRKWPSNGDLSIQRLTNQIETTMTIPQQQQQQQQVQLHQSSSSGIATTSMSSMPNKSSLKSGMRKPGVTFDETLEVYEVKNPHYGVEIKTEKKESKRKRREKMREEDIVNETWSRMKRVVLEHNMIPYFVSI
jgi:hypothetical protein